MKTYIAMLAVPLLILGCKTSSDNINHSLLPSATTKGRWLIQDTDGDIKGYLERDPIDSRRTLVMDDDGNIKGWYRKSAIDSRRRIFIKKK